MSILSSVTCLESVTNPDTLICQSWVWLEFENIEGKCCTGNTKFRNNMDKYISVLFQEYIDKECQNHNLMLNYKFNEYMIAF